MKLSHRLLIALIGCIAGSVYASGFVVSGSVGRGIQVSPSVASEPWNVMITPGYGFLEDLLRIELGIAATFPDIAARNYDLQLRPMLMINPPVIPLYFKVITAVGNLTTSPDFHFGGALGLGFSLLNFSVFVEGGYIPHLQSGNLIHSIEPRAGVSLHF